MANRGQLRPVAAMIGSRIGPGLIQRIAFPETNRDCLEDRQWPSGAAGTELVGNHPPVIEEATRAAGD
jgi:hypothetical protein